MAQKLPRSADVVVVAVMLLFCGYFGDVDCNHIVVLVLQDILVERHI